MFDTNLEIERAAVRSHRDFVEIKKQREVLRSQPRQVNHIMNYISNFLGGTKNSEMSPSSLPVFRFDFHCTKRLGFLRYTARTEY